MKKNQKLNEELEESYLENEKSLQKLVHMKENKVNEMESIAEIKEKIVVLRKENDKLDKLLMIQVKRNEDLDVVLDRQAKDLARSTKENWNTKYEGCDYNRHPFFISKKAISM